MRLLLNVQTASLMGFVGETNYHLERLVFLKRLRHNLNLPSRNFVRSCYEKRGTFKLCDIVSMDQKALPFVLDDGRAYEAKGSEEVWFSSSKTGLDKRQSTIQLTVFADGISRDRPTIIFRDEGKHIKASEKDSSVERVKVYFLKKVYRDEQLLKEWARDERGNIFTNPPRNGSTGKLLAADVYRAQQTDPVERLLQSKKTTLANLPPGCTNRVQLLNVVINKPFKNAIKKQFERHLDEKLDDYVDGKLTVSDRRVLKTNWVCNTWERICQSKDMIIHSSRKCGITTNVDGLENSQVNIRGLEDDVMFAPKEQFQLETSSSEENKDDEWVTDNDDNGNNNCATGFEESSTSDGKNKD